MPGTVAWTGGAGDGVWATAGNWAAGTGSAPPANGDTVTIGYGNASIHGATIATTTLTLNMLPSWGGIFGDDGPVIFSAGLTSLSFAGTGQSCNIACTGGTTTAASFTHTGSQVNITGGTWTTLTNAAGPMSIAAAAVVTTLNNGGGQITIGYNATAITTLANSGTVTCMRNITTANLNRGTLTHMDNGTTTYTAVTTANVGNGASYNKRSGGTDTTINALPGSRFSITGISGGSAGTVTCTTANIWGGSDFRKATNGLTLTITNENYIATTAGGFLGGGPLGAG